MNEYDKEVSSLAASYGVLIKENNDLQAKLEAAELENKKMFEQGLLLIHKNEREKELSYEHFFHWFKLDRDIKNVMIEFCKHFDKRKNHSTICEPPDNDGCGMLNLCVGIEQALSASPRESAEIIQGLVEALKPFAEYPLVQKSCDDYTLLVNPWGKEQKEIWRSDFGRAKEALAKYRGEEAEL